MKRTISVVAAVAIVAAIVISVLPRDGRSKKPTRTQRQRPKTSMVQRELDYHRAKLSEFIVGNWVSEPQDEADHYVSSLKVTKDAHATVTVIKKGRAHSYTGKYSLSFAVDEADAAFCSIAITPHDGAPIVLSQVGCVEGDSRHPVLLAICGTPSGVLYRQANQLSSAVSDSEISDNK